MTEQYRPRVRYVIGPDGSPLTIADLPPKNTKRWVIRRKAEVVAAVRGRRVWDSRGRPTVESEIHTVGGAVGRAIAPAGASTGSGEARATRDGGIVAFDGAQRVDPMEECGTDMRAGCTVSADGLQTSFERNVCTKSTFPKWSPR